MWSIQIFLIDTRILIINIWRRLKIGWIYSLSYSFIFSNQHDPKSNSLCLSIQQLIYQKISFSPSRFCLLIINPSILLERLKDFLIHSSLHFISFVSVYYSTVDPLIVFIELSNLLYLLGHIISKYNLCNNLVVINDWRLVNLESRIENWDTTSNQDI